MPTSIASTASTLSSLPGLHEALCYYIKPCPSTLSTTRNCKAVKQSHNVYIMPLVINALGDAHTQTHIPMNEQKQFQETWFKNTTTSHILQASYFLEMV